MVLMMKLREVGRSSEFLRVDRVDSEIKIHPEALRMAEEEEWQDKRHRKADEQQGNWLLCDGKPGGQWYDDDRYQ